MPVIITVSVVVTAAAVGVYFWRKRKETHQESDL